MIAAMSVMVALVGGVSGQDFPKPKLRLVSVSDTVNNGHRLKLYEVEVVNREEFDNELFVPSPALPACGVNRSASRTWVDIFNEKGARIYGFCALKVNGELATLRFSVPADRPQPKKIFIELVDRFEERVVRSNTVSVE
jgi:hypothetical protein